jgi:hypothetical protein
MLCNRALQNNTPLLAPLVQLGAAIARKAQDIVVLSVPCCIRVRLYSKGSCASRDQAQCMINCPRLTVDQLLINRGKVLDPLLNRIDRVTESNLGNAQPIH